jgi:hypothetical protein
VRDEHIGIQREPESRVAEGFRWSASEYIDESASIHLAHALVNMLFHGRHKLTSSGLSLLSTLSVRSTTATD